MRKFAFLAAIGAVLALPASGQETMPSPPSGPEMTVEQTMTYESWGVDHQAMYDGWPAEAKAYFWSLSPLRQELFFQLSDENRAMMLSMPDSDREAAWQIVEAQAQPGVPGSERVPDAPPMMEEKVPPPPGGE